MTDALTAALRELIAPIVRDAVADALAELEPREAPPAMVDTSELGRQIGASRTTIHRLRGGGMPCVMLGDSPRYVVAEVIAWLRARGEREATAGVCTTCGTPHEDASPGECARGGRIA